MLRYFTLGDTVLAPSFFTQDARQALLVATK
jgi:hypothetical protein